MTTTKQAKSLTAGDRFHRTFNDFTVSRVEVAGPAHVAVIGTCDTYPEDGERTVALFLADSEIELL